MICLWECGNMALNNYQDADFTPDITPSDVRPNMGTYNSPQTFRFWCQKVLPLVYDDSLSYYELLCKVVDYLNKTMEDVNTAVEDVENLNSAFGSLENHVNASETALLQAYNDLQDYVNTYFNNLDVQEEINNKLDVMAEDGTLDTILLPYFNEYTQTTNEVIDERFETQNGVLSNQNNRITVLEGRMNEFSSLPDGSLSTAADAELVDIRVGTDGITYPSAGDAVRNQIGNLKNAVSGKNDATISTDWQNVNLARYSTGVIQALSSDTRISTTKKYALFKNQFVTIKTQPGYKHRVIFFQTLGLGTVVINTTYNVSMGVYDDVTNWHTESKRILQTPEGAVAYAVTLAKVDDSSITTSDCTNVSICSSFGANFYRDYSIDDVLDNIDAFFGIKLPNYIKNKFAFNYGYVSGDGSITNAYEQRAAYYEVPVTEEHGYAMIFDVVHEGMCLAWYDADGTFISRNNYYQSGQDRASVVSPSDAAYVKVAVFDKDPVRYNFSYVSEHNFILTDAEYENFNSTWFNDYPDIQNSGFYGKKISILGDSISTFAGEGSSTAADGHKIADGTYTYAGNHCRYPESFMPYASCAYWLKLIGNLGMTLGVNDSWAGSRVSWDGQEGSDYGANIYIASPTRIGHLDDNGTPDIILVNAGTNDIGTNVPIGTFNTESPVNYTDAQIAALPVATFADAYRALLIRLQKAYPLARIVVMLPNYTTSYYNPTNADAYLEVIKEACDYFGVPWVDMRMSGITMYNTGTYMGDGIHPNTKGMKMLFDKVYKFFKYEL